MATERAERAVGRRAMHFSTQSKIEGQPIDRMESQAMRPSADLASTESVIDIARRRRGIADSRPARQASGLPVRDFAQPNAFAESNARR